VLGFVFLRLHIYTVVFWLWTVTVGRIQSEQVDINMQQDIVTSTCNSILLNMLMLINFCDGTVIMIEAYKGSVINTSVICCSNFKIFKMKLSS